MSKVTRKLSLGLGLAAVVLGVALAVTSEASAKSPPFHPWTSGPSTGVWSPGPNQLNMRLGQYGTQYNWNNSGGILKQTYGPGGMRNVYEQNQFFRGQRTSGPGGNHGWVESPFLPGARLTW